MQSSTVCHHVVVVHTECTAVQYVTMLYTLSVLVTSQMSILCITSCCIDGECSE